MVFLSLENASCARGEYRERQAKNKAEGDGKTSEHPLGRRSSRRGRAEADARASIALLLVHDTQQRLTHDEAADVLPPQPPAPIHRLRRLAADVRADDRVRLRPQPV